MLCVTQGSGHMLDFFFIETQIKLNIDILESSSFSSWL